MERRSLAVDTLAGVGHRWAKRSCGVGAESAVVAAQVSPNFAYAEGICVQLLSCLHRRVCEPFELLLFVGEPPRIRLVPDVERVDMPPVMLFDLALLDADETERPVLLLLVVLDRADDLLRHFPVPFVFRPENGEADRPECDPYHDGRAQTPAAPLRQTRIRMSGNILKTILEIARFFQGGEIRQADFS